MYFSIEKLIGEFILAVGLGFEVRTIQSDHFYSIVLQIVSILLKCL